jgi:hypothetical protein
MRIERSGVWLYNETVDQGVDVVSLPYDYWFEFARADGTLDDGEQPETLGPNGVLYYVRFRRVGDVAEPIWVDSPGHPDLADAMAFAESRVPSPIRWISA